MNTLLSYFIQVSISSGVLYGYYHFFLRNKRFHQYNRFYLLGAVVLSLLVPLLQIPVYFTQTEKESSLVLKTLVQLSPATPAPAAGTLPVIAQQSDIHDIFSLMKYGYLIIVLLALLRVILSFYRIWQLYRFHPAEKLEKIRFIRTRAPGTPFSFFRWLFWDEQIDLHSAKGNQVFRHELFHIRQRHSIDIVFMELVTSIGWLNPFFHLIRKELKAIHEFLADRFACTEKTKWEYAELLLMQALNTSNSIVNPFFHNQIKRRIAMITQSSAPGAQYFRKLMVLPVALLLFGLFAFSFHPRQNDVIYSANFNPHLHVNFSGKLKKDTTPVKDQRIFITSDSVIFYPDASGQNKTAFEGLLIVNGEKMNPRAFTNISFVAKAVTIYPKNDPAAMLLYGEEARNGVTILQEAHLFKSNTDAAAAATERAAASMDRHEIDPPAYEGGDAAWRKFLEKTLNVSFLASNKAAPGIYKVMVSFVVNEEGLLTGFNAVSRHGFGMEEELINTLKKCNRWYPAVKDGKRVSYTLTQPVLFQVGKGNNLHSFPNPETPLLNEVVFVAYSEEKDAYQVPEMSLAEIQKAKPHQLLGLDAETEIIGFMFTTDLDDNRIAEVYNAGDQFSPPVIKLINSLKPDRLVTLDMIRIRKDGKEIKIAAKAYKIVP